MKPFDPELAELQSNTARRYCRFNIAFEQWEKPEVVSVCFEHLTFIKWLFNSLDLHAKAEMVSGQTDQALKDINVMFQLNDGLKDEPLLISQLVRLACTAILLQPVAEGLAEHRWSDTQLQVLQERLQKIDLIGSIVMAMHGERDICANSRFDKGEMFPSGWNRLEQLNINRSFHELVFPRIDLTAREINPSVNHSIDLTFQKFSGGNLLRIALIATFHLRQNVAAWLFPSATKNRLCANRSGSGNAGVRLGALSSG